jgi:hypothetical protein
MTHIKKLLVVASALLSLAGGVSAAPAPPEDAIVKRIPVRHATAPLTLVGDYLFVAGADEATARRPDRAPALYRIDTTTLQVRRETLEIPVYRFQRSQGKLLGGHDVNKALATFDSSIELTTDPNNVGFQDALRLVYGSALNRGEPSEWNRPELVSGGPYCPQTVLYRGRCFRPVEGGHVKLLRSDGATLYPGALAELPQSWGIFLSAAAPVGFGDGGVYALDANLAISSKLIDLGRGQPIAPGVEPRPRRAAGIAGDGKTFGVVASAPDGLNANGLRSDLEVWTADGRRKLRSEPVIGITDLLPQDRIMPLDGGYLLVTGEVLWVPASADAPGKGAATWRYRPAGAGTGLRKPWFLSAPVVNNGYVFAAGRDGDLYVFDQSKITGAVLPPRRTSPAGPKYIERGISISKRPAAKLSTASTP